LVGEKNAFALVDTMLLDHLAINLNEAFVNQLLDAAMSSDVVAAGRVAVPSLPVQARCQWKT
jgi:hypothetical protein